MFTKGPTLIEWNAIVPIKTKSSQWNVDNPLIGRLISGRNACY